MDETPHRNDGLWSTFKRLLGLMGDVAGNRVELFVVEWEEERRRLLDALALLLGAGVCFLMALFVITFAMVAIFWDTHRALVLTLFILVYLGAAVLALLVLRSRLRRWRAFSATLEQFKKDRVCFKNQN